MSDLIMNRYEAEVRHVQKERDEALAKLRNLRAENKRLREAMDPRLLLALRAAVGPLRDMNRPNTADALDELRVILAGREGG